MTLHRALLAAVICFAAPAFAQEAASLFAATDASTTLVPIKGVVSGTPESVSFSGSAKVSSRLAPDPDFNRPRLVLSIDMSGVSGTGSTSGAKYTVYGPELTQRSVAASHTVEFAFPFKSSTSATAATARTGVAAFVLDFDVNTGAVTRASGGVSTPNFPR